MKSFIICHECQNRLMIDLWCCIVCIMLYRFGIGTYIVLNEIEKNCVHSDKRNMWN